MKKYLCFLLLLIVILYFTANCYTLFRFRICKRIRYAGG